MTAIDAYLVDVKNVNTHKVVELKVHVSQERAMEVFELFGWPTMVNPVSIAIARLNEGSFTLPNKEKITEVTISGIEKIDIPEFKPIPFEAGDVIELEGGKITATKPKTWVKGSYELGPEGFEKPKREMTLAEKVFFICRKPEFAQYIVQRTDYNQFYQKVCKTTEEFDAVYLYDDEKLCRDFVCWYCGVKSRSDIIYDTPEAAKWKTLYEEYEQWLSSSIKGEER